MEIDEEGEGDVVVRELDVFLCKPDLGPNTQFCLLQSPLRPAWRPYNYEKPYDEARFKPRHRRLELKVPVATTSENYNAFTPDARLQIDHLTLKSSLMDTHGSFAVGSIRGNALFLTPIDYGLQLRPSLNHLNSGAPDEKPPPEDIKEEVVEDEDAGTYKPVNVNVQRRETERQYDTRVKSFAHLKAEEDKEAWQKLKPHAADSPEAEVVWEQLRTPVDELLPLTTSPAQYLAELSPGSGLLTDPDQATGGASSGPSQAASSRSHEPAPPRIPDWIRTVLPQVMLELFAKQAVNNLEDVRAHMRGSTDAPLISAATLPDSDLHGLIAACKNVWCIRKVYVARETTSPKLNPFRTLLLQELSERESLKKTEIAEAAAAQGVALPEMREYNRILKEYCTSRGAYWVLRQGNA